MEAEINREGELLLKRAGKFKRQYCPYTHSGERVYPCGDDCPKFDEIFGVNERHIIACGIFHELVEDERSPKDV